MQLTVTSVDYAPDELYEQAPFVVELLRQMVQWMQAVALAINKEAHDEQDHR